MKKRVLTKNNGGDYTLLILVVLIAAFGVLAIYSASKYNALKTYGNAYYFSNKQLIGLLLGLVCMIFTANFNYYKLKKFAVWIFIISIILLALVFVPKISVEVYGAKRWIKLGFFTIQPSEIAKFSYVILFASYISKDFSRAKSFKAILPMLACGLLLCLLIIFEPNMSITVSIGLLMVSLLFISGVKLSHFAVILVPLIVLVPVLIIIEPYRLARLTAFLNPWASPKGEGYQLLQSLYALGSGGWFGVGLFNSRQKFGFLPFAESDFILSVIGEELGFVGLFLLFCIFFIVVIKGIKIAKNSKDGFSFLLATGIVLVFAIQVILNALVVTGSIPPTGLPLPLISAGNTSLIVFLAAFGLLFNISKNNDKALINGWL